MSINVLIYANVTLCFLVTISVIWEMSSFTSIKKNFIKNYILYHLVLWLIFSLSMQVCEMLMDVLKALLILFPLRKLKPSLQFISILCITILWCNKNREPLDVLNQQMCSFLGWILNVFPWIPSPHPYSKSLHRMLSSQTWTVLILALVPVWLAYPGTLLLTQ